MSKQPRRGKRPRYIALIATWLALALLLSASAPPATPTKEAKVNKDPLANFDFLWQTFDERYAFFKLHGVDWAKARTTYRPKLTSRSSDLDLYRVMQDMTDLLQDYHVDWTVPKAIASQYEGKFDSNPYKSKQFPQMAKQLFEAFSKRGSSYDNGSVRWGMIDNTRVGLLQINEMMDLVSCKDLQSIAPGQPCTKAMKDTQAIGLVMNKVVKDFHKAQAVIIDLRFNIGGYDEVSREILQFFITQKSKAYSKQEKRKEGLTKIEHVDMTPTPNHLSTRLFVLTSHITASAAEVFVLSAMHLKHVTIVGGRTQGILSDMYESRLPNGWKFTLSNEIYYSVKGKVYELIGVPPHVNINYPVAQPQALLHKLATDLKAGNDAIAMALRLFQKGPRTKTSKPTRPTKRATNARKKTAGSR